MNGRVRSDAYRRYGFLAGLLTIALLVSISLVGCGGGQSASGPQGGAPERRAFEGETLTLVLKEGYEIEAIQEYKEDFEKATGTTVEIEVYDEPTARQKFILDSIPRRSPKRQWTSCPWKGSSTRFPTRLSVGCSSTGMISSSNTASKRHRHRTMFCP